MVKNTLELLKDENLPRFKSNALARAKEFSLPNILPMYEELYEKALSEVVAS